MQIKGFLAGAAALSMVASPALAAPVSPAASLSVAKSVRAHATSTNGSGFAFTTEVFEIIVAIGIIAAAVVVLTDDSPNTQSAQSPKSP